MLFKILFRKTLRCSQRKLNGPEADGEKTADGERTTDGGKLNEKGD